MGFGRGRGVEAKVTLANVCRRKLEEKTLVRMHVEDHDHDEKPPYIPELFPRVIWLCRN